LDIQVKYEGPRKPSSNRLLSGGTLLAWIAGARKIGGGQAVTKIEFLLMIISVFVALSYIPIRTEPKQTNAARSDSLPA
jgi:hypothetical protein